MGMGSVAASNFGGVNGGFPYVGGQFAPDRGVSVGPATPESAAHFQPALSTGTGTSANARIQWNGRPRDASHPALISISPGGLPLKGTHPSSSSTATATATGPRRMDTSSSVALPLPLRGASAAWGASDGTMAGGNGSLETGWGSPIPAVSMGAAAPIADTPSADIGVFGLGLGIGSGVGVTPALTEDVGAGIGAGAGAGAGAAVAPTSSAVWSSSGEGDAIGIGIGMDRNLDGVGTTSTITVSPVSSGAAFVHTGTPFAIGNASDVGDVTAGSGNGDTSLRGAALGVGVGGLGLSLGGGGTAWGSDVGSSQVSGLGLGLGVLGTALDAQPAGDADGSGSHVLQE